MALQLGVDYAFAKKISFLFETGVGNAFVVMTPKTLYMFPYDTTGGGGRTITTTTTTIGDQHPLLAIEALLADPETTPEHLAATITRWCEQVSGPKVHELSEFGRIKLRDGFFTRGVVLNPEGANLIGMSNIAFRPTKQEMVAFHAILDGDERLH